MRRLITSLLPLCPLWRLAISPYLGRHSLISHAGTAIRYVHARPLICHGLVGMVAKSVISRLTLGAKVYLRRTGLS